jgi:hypothetical protein
VVGLFRCSANSWGCSANSDAGLPLGAGSASELTSNIIANQVRSQGRTPMHSPDFQNPHALLKTGRVRVASPWMRFALPLVRITSSPRDVWRTV